jgi:hypothetical protein
MNRGRLIWGQIRAFLLLLFIFLELQLSALDGEEGNWSWNMFVDFFFLAELGFELMALHLLSGYSTT